jgi:formamidopyrimidine-DNA glycosylase
MPELPEVETVRRGLAPVMEGYVLTHVEARRPDLRFPLPQGFAQRLVGRRVERLRRRAKYLLADLDGGEVLLMHLGMSGRFTIGGTQLGEFHHAVTVTADGLGTHDHIVFETSAGARIVYADHRRFGMMDLFGHNEGHKLIDALGPEPLGPEFSASVLAEKLAGKKTPIKAALLDQTIVAGLGNIYVCEALHRSGISPKRLAYLVDGKRCARLVPEIKAVLQDAIEAGGSSLRDFKQASGELGYFQHSFRVYDQDGEACPTAGCRGTIARIVQSGRSTFYCPKCQR